MPILHPSDALIARLGLNENAFGSTLPNPSTAANTFSEYASEAVKESFAREQMANMSVGYQRLTGNVMRTIGAPQGDAVLGDGQFNAAMGLLRIPNIASDMLGALGEYGGGLMDLAHVPKEIQEILMEVLGDLLAPLMAQIGSIPVYGWILEAAFDLIMGIVKIVQIFKHQNDPDPEREYALAQFDPDTDKRVSGEIMNVTHTSPNWTNIYMPPGIGHIESWHKKDFFVQKLTDDAGYRLTSAGHHEGWAGLVPGTSQIDHGFEIFNRGGNSRGLGELFPTTRNLNVSIWDQLNKITPTMYTVDAVQCMRYWEGHLRELLEQLFASDYEGAEAFVGNGKGSGPAEKYFGWSSWAKGKAAWEKWGSDGAGYDGDQDAYLDDLGVSRRIECTPAHAMHALYKRQLEGLNTTVCAYVDSGYFGAFQGEIKFQPETQALIDRYEKNRMTLLGHPARCDIDASNIPDHTYKAKMEGVQESCLPSHLGMIVPRITDGRRRLRPTRHFLDYSAAPPVNQSPGGRRAFRFRPFEGRKRSGGRRTKGSGGLILGLGGIAVLTSIMMRKK